MTGRLPLFPQPRNMDFAKKTFCTFYPPPASVQIKPCRLLGVVLKDEHFGVCCLCWKIWRSGESENEADTNYADQKSYLGDRAPTPFSQTSKCGLCKKDVLHFLTTASMRTNQTLPALGGGIERRIFWCISFILEIEKSAKTEKLVENIFLQSLMWRRMD